MKRVGNAASNRKYNPQNKKPPVPVDADEADSAMERFIRSKYVQSPSSLNRGVRQSGASESDEGTPPPLPPVSRAEKGLRYMLGVCESFGETAWL